MSFAVTTFAHGGFGGSDSSSWATGAFVATAGNLLVVAVSMYNPVSGTIPPTLTDTAGNSFTLIGTSPTSPTVSDGTPNIWFFYSNNILGNAANVVTAHTAAGSSTFVEVVAWQMSAAATGNPVNTFQIGGGATASNAQSTAALTTTTANTIVVAYGSLSNTGATYTAGTGYTLDMGTADDGGLSGAEHIQYSSVQVGVIPAITATDSTHKWQMMAVAIAGASQPSGGGGSGLWLAMDASVRNSGLRH